jgi:flagellar hook-associated protein 3 FlgL
MSGSLSNIYDSVSYALNLQSSAIARLQEQASTGSKINKASDDPSSAYRVLGLSSQERTLQNYMDNISETSSTLEISLKVVEDMTSTILDKKVSLSQAISGTYNQNNRESEANDINDALEQMVSLANTRHMDQYIFGGGNTGSAPYVVTRTNGEITGVSYQGSSEDRNIDVAPGIKSSAFYVGEDIFSSNNRGEAEFVGQSGAAAGTGTSNVKGDVWLTVTNDGSNYKLSIDGGTTEVTVPNSGDLTNIAVTDSNGNVLYVDATNISKTGVDMVRIPGTYDVFNTLISIRDILRNEQGLSDSQVTELLGKGIESLEEMRGLLVDKSTLMGSRIGFLEKISESLDNIKTNTTDESTYLQESDIAQIAIDLSRSEALYQMSLSVAGKLMSMSLLDFIE